MIFYASTLPKRGSRMKKKKTDNEIPSGTDMEPIKLDSFVPYPPSEFIFDRDKQPPWIITQTELIQRDPEKTIALITRRESFAEKKNPVLAIEAFILAHELKVYPPLWALKFFSDAFKRYHDKLGLVDLDSILGLKGVGKKGGAFKPLLDDQRDEMLMIDVFRWTRPPFNLSVKHAADIVARLLQATPDNVFNKTWINLKKLKASTIRDRYLKKWSKLFEFDVIVDIHDKWLQANRANFLLKFEKVLTKKDLDKFRRIDK